MSTIVNASFNGLWAEEFLTIYGVRVRVTTMLTSPYGDATMSFAVLLGDYPKSGEALSIHFVSGRGVAESPEIKEYKIRSLSNEDLQILLSSVQHNLNLEKEIQNVYNKLKQLDAEFQPRPLPDGAIG